MLTRWILPAFRNVVHILYRQPPSCQSRVNLVKQLSTDFQGGVHFVCRQPPSGQSGGFKYSVVFRWRSLPRIRRHRASSPQGGCSSTGAAFSDITMNQHCLSFHTLMVCSGQEDVMQEASEAAYSILRRIF